MVSVLQVGVVPAVMAMEIGFLGKSFSAMQYASVALVCLGAGICTVQDMQVNWRQVCVEHGPACMLVASLQQAIFVCHARHANVLKRWVSCIRSARPPLARFVLQAPS